MADLARRALLPNGMRDILPPEAAFEADTVARLMAALAAEGYERVKPPLVEFEDSLLAGSGVAMAQHTFRMMDPVSQRMMGVRADMTLQIARIAATRLKKVARPLRLSYAGQVLRVAGDEMRPERQIGQVGAELIGSAAAAADAEVVRLCATALVGVGVERLTIDLSTPDLVPIVASAYGFAGDEARKLRKALDHKDSATVAEMAGAAAPLFDRLIRAAGPAHQCLAALAGLDLPAGARAEIARAAEVVAMVEAASPGLALALDPVESRGFEYHTGLCFTLLAAGVRGELGRGGRYFAGEDLSPGHGEPATGFTVYTDTLLRAIPARPAARRIFVPFGTSPAVAQSLRAEGWTTIAGLAPADDAGAEAQRFGCTHLLDTTGPRKASSKKD
jgi:ATP phosphoribosyltransferase regulatory subunit